MSDRKNETKDLHDLGHSECGFLKPFQWQPPTGPRKTVGTLLTAEVHYGNSEVPVDMLV